MYGKVKDDLASNLICGFIGMLVGFLLPIYFLIRLGVSGLWFAGVEIVSASSLFIICFIKKSVMLEKLIKIISWIVNVW